MGLLYIYIYIYVCVCVCMYIYIYIYYGDRRINRCVSLATEEKRFFVASF